MNIEDCLSTTRLDLIPVTRKSILIELDSESSLNEYLKSEIPLCWPPPLMTNDTLYEFLDLMKDPNDIRLFAYYWVRKGEIPDNKRVLIGSGGFFYKSVGYWELGYSVLDEFQNLGYATEAASRMIEWFFAFKKSDRILATTYPYLYASLRVLQKCGFLIIGKGEDEGSIQLEKKKGKLF